MTMNAEQARKWRLDYPEVAASIKVRYRKKNLKRIRKADRDRQRMVRAQPEAQTLQRARYDRWRGRREGELTAQAGRPRPDRCEMVGCNSGEKVVFDHCHIGQHFRGWICDRCNKMLGLAKDNPAMLRSLAQYLEDDMAKLSTEARKKLPASSFAGPDRSYPVNDKAHAANAKARVANKSPGLKAKVDAKANKILGKGKSAPAKKGPIGSKTLGSMAASLK